jgi:hypothetical protein
MMELKIYVDAEGRNRQRSIQKNSLEQRKPNTALGHVTEICEEKGLDSRIMLTAKET